MTDREMFERQLGTRLVAHVRVNDRPFDADLVAHTAVARAGIPAGFLRRLRADGRNRRPLVRAFVVIMLLLALVGGAVVVGSQLLTAHPDPLIPPDRGAFTAAGTPVYRHEGYIATLLRDGRVLVVGGWENTDTAETWDPDTMTFSPTGSLIIPRTSGHTATLLPDGKVLVLGGHQGSCDGCPDPVLVAETWNPMTGSFSVAGAMGSADALSNDPTTGLGMPPQVLSDGRVLVGRGPTAEVFDPDTRSFEPAGSLGDLPYVPAGTRLLDGRVLVISGDGQAQVWNPVAGLFIPTGSLLEDRGGCGLTPPGTAVLLRDGRVLVVGGSTVVGHSCPPVASAEIWDPRTDEFAPTGPMPETMRYSTATLLQDGRVLVVGPGDSSGDDTATAYLFELK